MNSAGVVSWSSDRRRGLSTLPPFVEREDACVSAGRFPRASCASLQWCSCNPARSRRRLRGMQFAWLATPSVLPTFLIRSWGSLRMNLTVSERMMLSARYVEFARGAVERRESLSPTYTSAFVNLFVSVLVRVRVADDSHVENVVPVFRLALLALSILSSFFELLDALCEWCGGPFRAAFRPGPWFLFRRCADGRGASTCR